MNLCKNCGCGALYMRFCVCINAKGLPVVHDGDDCRGNSKGNSNTNALRQMGFFDEGLNVQDVIAYLERQCS